MTKKTTFSAPLKSALILALAGTIIFISAPSALSQNSSPAMRKDKFGNQYAKELPNLSAFAITDKWVEPKGKKFIVEFNISYPKDTGNASLDKFFRLEADKQRGNYLKESYGEYIKICHEIGGPSACTGYSQAMFEAYSPRADILSVIAGISNTPPGGNGGESLKSYNYYLTNARELSLSDVFPDYGRSLPLLWRKIVSGWCAHPENTNHQFPSFYEMSVKNADCRASASIPIPASLKSAPASFDSLGNAFLTPDGMTLRLYGFESFGWSHGTVDLKLGKRDLVKMGADPSVWGRTRNYTSRTN